MRASSLSQSLRRGSSNAPCGGRRFASAAANEVVIVSAVRTPIGAFNGSLAKLKAAELGAVAIRAAIERAGLQGSDVDELYMGNVLPANSGQAPSRQAGLAAGLPESVACTDINKVCASGMKTIMLASQGIMLGHTDTVVTGGMESMSQVPCYIEKGLPAYGHSQIKDGILRDGLWDVYNDFHMGMCAEKCAKDFDLSREAQDEYALLSYERAAASIASGAFDAELVPVEVPQGRGRDPLIFSQDEEPGNLRAEKVPALRPAFQKDGTVTAANASKLNDGAASLVVMSRAKAEAMGLTPLAAVLGFADAAQAPVDFTTAPALAVPKALAMAGVAAGDVALHEINEAFAAVALANMRILDIPLEKVNVRGGAIALGHPIGCSGARIVVSLVHNLRETQGAGSVGVASICNGGGGASAIVVKAL